MHTGVVRLPAALVVLVLVAGAAILSGCDGDPSPPAATPTVEATPAAAAPTAPAPTPTDTPSPTPTAEATPTVTTTPSPTPASSRTPTATPSPTPTATPAPLVTAEDLGIREVDTAEALAAAGLTHARYEAGEEVPWELGVYLLEVGSGAIEGWTCPGQRHQCSGLYLSPSNRFLSFADYLHDRQTERTYADVRTVGMAPQHEGGLGDLVGWGAGGNERLLVALEGQGLPRYVVLDDSLQPVAQREAIAGGYYSSQRGRYQATRDGQNVRLADLEAGIDPTAVEIVERPLPGDIRWPQIFELVDLHAGSDAVVLTVPGDADSSRVIRYGWDGELLSDVTLRRLPRYGGRLNTSPNGNLVAGETFEPTTAAGPYGEPLGMAISVFDAATGEEILRIPGATTPQFSRIDWRVEDGVLWLSDSSGVVVGTTRGDRLVTLKGHWESVVGWPAPDNTSVFAAGTTVTDREGRVVATLRTGPTARPFPESVLLNFVGWGDHSREMRIELYTVDIARDWPGWSAPPLTPVIDSPPFEDRLRAEVVVDTCLNLREEPSREAAIVTCLPSGAVVETDDYDIWKWPDSWMHLRTDDGLEGWAHADYLRWHSDGVRLEE